MRDGAADAVSVSQPLLAKYCFRKEWTVLAYVSSSLVRRPTERGSLSNHYLPLIVEDILRPSDIPVNRVSLIHSMMPLLPICFQSATLQRKRS